MKEQKITFLSLVFSGGWRLFPLVLLIGLTSLSGAYPIKLIERIVNAATATGVDRVLDIARLGGLYTAFFMVWSLSKYALQITYRRLEAQQGHKLRLQIFDHTTRLKPLALSHKTSGDMVADALKDTDVATSQFMKPIVYIVESIVGFTVGMWLMLSIDWRMTLFMFPLGLFAAVIARSSGGRMRELSGDVRDRTTSMWSLFTEAVRGLKDAQANSAVCWLYNRLNSQSGETAQSTIREAAYYERVQASNSFFSMTVIGLIMTLGAVLVAQGSLSIGGLTAFMMYNGMLVDPVMNFITFYKELQVTRVSIGRLNELLAQPAYDQEQTAGALAGPPEIRVNNVSFSYGEGNPALQRVCIHIDAGAHVAIVGPSGCGKTTLAHLVAGVYMPDAGEVSVGGVAVTEANLSTIRAQIAMVFQEPFLFNTTIEENICLGTPQASPRQLKQAVRSACLEDYVAASEIGLQTIVGENGNRLSGGERQRVGIARALLRQTPVYIMDEATSALDNTTAKHVLENVLQSCKDSTVLVIAHRITAITSFPRILVMAEGWIIADGTHAELMESCALYAQLYEHQFAEDRLTA